MEDFIQAAFMRKLMLDGITTVILIFMDNELHRDYHRYLQPLWILCLLHAAQMILMLCFPFFPNGEIANIIFLTLIYVVMFTIPVSLLFFWIYVYVRHKDERRYSLPLKFSILQAALMILFCCAPFFPDWEITNIAFLILVYVIASSAIAMPFLWTGVYVLTRQCRMNPFFCIAAFVFWGNVFLQCFFSFYGVGILTGDFP